MATAVPPRLDWDDELWVEVWDRLLGPVERHAIARDVWRRRLPDDDFHAQIAIELAHRWRRTARNLAVLYTLWTVFWGVIGWHQLRVEQDLGGALLPLTVGIGLLAIAGAVAFRRRLRPLVALRAAQGTGPGPQPDESPQGR